MKKRHNLVAAAMTLVLSFAASGPSAAAVVLFSDNFNRSNSNTVGNGWSERERSSNDVGICCGNDQLRLRDDASGLPDAAVASTLIDATGFENISVHFKWTAFSANEVGNLEDRLHLAWDLDPTSPLSAVETSAWTQAWDATSGGGTFTTSVNLASAVANSIFRIAFWTNVSRSNEGFLIDYVVVKGDAVSEVPLPAAAPLLLGGLATLGFAGRRRRKS